jgi:hypothetical protein
MTSILNDSVADPDPNPGLCCRIKFCLALPDPHPLVRDTDPDSSIIKQK